MISSLSAGEAEAALPDLGELLADAVAGDASVGFRSGLTAERAAAWWAALLPEIASGQMVVLAARDGGGPVRGTVCLNRHTSENGSHRAEVAKHLVHRSARRRGWGEALMRAAEAEARRLGLSLLLLDTRSGSDAERLYRRLGWAELGRVPDYAYTPGGRLDATTFMYLPLG